MFPELSRFRKRGRERENGRERRKTKWNGAERD
jgi:hypothetical protein